MNAVLKQQLDRLQVKYKLVERVRSLQELKLAVDREFPGVSWEEVVVIPGETDKLEFVLMLKSEADLLWWKLQLAPVIDQAFKGK